MRSVLWSNARSRTLNYENSLFDYESFNISDLTKISLRSETDFFLFVHRGLNLKQNTHWRAACTSFDTVLIEVRVLNEVKQPSSVLLPIPSGFFIGCLVGQ